MVPLSPPHRLARPEDAPALARLVNMAGHGMPLHLWTRIAGTDGDPWEIGAERQRAKVADGQVVVADEGSGAVASLTGYVASHEEIDPDTPALFVPLIELENEVPGSWYVNVLATLPEARGRGLGSGLMKLAERIARSEGCDRMSLITAGDNTDALRLYRRQGYREIARRDCVRDGWETDQEDWVLMVRDLSG